MNDIKKIVQEHSRQLVELRRDLHRHPELGHQEERTAGLIEKTMRDCGLSKISRLTGTGVAGLLTGAKPGPVLLLRADIDALPVQEDSGLDFSSTTPGVMHACGHDAHTAVLLTAMKILVGLKDQLAGSVKFVFEPNEEKVGALAMIEEGVMDDPKVDAAAGLHIWAPVPLGLIASNPGPTWAGMDHFTIAVKGQGGHSASPHTAVDPVLAAAAIIQAAQVLQSRELDPFLASTLLFGRLSGGSAANIIPDLVELEGTLRYLFDGSDDGPHRPRVRLREIAASVAKTSRATAEVDFYCTQPSLINDPRMAELGREAALATLGPDSPDYRFVTLAGEDFSEFALRAPAIFAVIGGGSQESGAVYPHHHPKFRIDEKALPIALEWLLHLTFNYFKA
jgi:amidohydrolase